MDADIDTDADVDTDAGADLDTDVDADTDSDTDPPGQGDAWVEIDGSSARGYPTGGTLALIRLRLTLFGARW